MSVRIFPAAGPPLPPFESLLIKGSYAPSAPIHLCISHLQSTDDVPGNVLFVTPSRQSFAAALQDFNDGWLVEHAATGAYARLLSKIDIHYPPSTAHWLLLLSLLKPLSSSPSKLSVLPYAPSLMVLHEPSAYFLSSDLPRTYVGNGCRSALVYARGPVDHKVVSMEDLSQYVQLVATALSTASFFSSRKGIPLVLFDSRLGDLMLPIVRPLTPSRRLFEDRETETHVRQERVERFVEKYFDWVGAVVDEHEAQEPRTPPRHGTFESSAKKRIGPFKLLLERRQSDDSEQVVLRWSERKCTRRANAPFSEIEFVFQDVD